MEGGLRLLCLHKGRSLVGCLQSGTQNLGLGSPLQPRVIPREGWRCEPETEGMNALAPKGESGPHIAQYHFILLLRMQGHESRHLVYIFLLHLYPQCPQRHTWHIIGAQCTVVECANTFYSTYLFIVFKRLANIFMSQIFKQISPKT